MKRAQSHTGPSQRQLRVGELIRRELADILARGDHFEPDLAGCLISVGEVQASPDLKIATVYFYPHGKDPQIALSALSKIAPRLRKDVTSRIHLKFSPELRFKIDKSYDHIENTQNLINALPKYEDE